MNSDELPPNKRGFDRRGYQIEQLDALLTERALGRPSAHTEIEATGLEPLLSAADVLVPLAEAKPSDAFAVRLEARLLARSALRAVTQPAITPLNVRALPPGQSRGAVSRRHMARVSWVTVAALMLVSVTVGALTASAHAGSPLYGLRKAVDGISASLTDSAGASARASLQRASADLRDFITATSQDDIATALTALDRLSKDDHQAATAISQVANSGERSTLQSQLDSLRAQETSTLRGALPTLDWSARVRVTNALRAINATALIVTSAHIRSNPSGSGTRSPATVVITVKGNGFVAGAVLLINGQPAGVVDSVSPHMLVANLPAGATGAGITSVGVGEPDGVAASTTRIESNDDNENDPSGTSGSGGSSTPGSHYPGSDTPTPDSRNGSTP
jgi:hypothetical protein